MSISEEVLTESVAVDLRPVDVTDQQAVVARAMIDVVSIDPTTVRDDADEQTPLLFFSEDAICLNGQKLQRLNARQEELLHIFIANPNVPLSRAMIKELGYSGDESTFAATINSLLNLLSSKAKLQGLQSPIAKSGIKRGTRYTFLTDHFVADESVANNEPQQVAQSAEDDLPIELQDELEDTTPPEVDKQLGLTDAERGLLITVLRTQIANPGFRISQSSLRAAVKNVLPAGMSEFEVDVEFFRALDVVRQTVESSHVGQLEDRVMINQKAYGLVFDELSNVDDLIGALEATGVMNEVHLAELFEIPTDIYVTVSDIVRRRSATSLSRGQQLQAILYVQDIAAKLSQDSLLVKSECGRRFVELADRGKNMLVKANLRTIDHLIKKHGIHYQPFSHGDLVQFGAMGLVKAIERFDVSLGNSFISFAEPNIVGEILRGIRDTGESIKSPRSVRETAIQITKLVTSGHFDINDDKALAVELVVSVDLIHKAKEWQAMREVKSLDAPLGEENSGTLHDTVSVLAIEQGDSSAYEPVDPNAIKEALHHLPARERRIVRHYFGLSGQKPKTQQQIAELLGISQMHVSRLLSKSLAIMEPLLAEHKDKWGYLEAANN